MIHPYIAIASSIDLTSACAGKLAHQLALRKRQPQVQVAYYHVNFKAALRGDGRPYTFFAEVTGEEEPAAVTTVTLFITKGLYIVERSSCHQLLFPNRTYYSG